MRFVLILSLVGLIPPQAPSLVESGDKLPSQAPDLKVPSGNDPPVFSLLDGTAQAPSMTHPNWLSSEPYHEGAEWFKGSKKTQMVYNTTSGWNHIEEVGVEHLDPKWQMSGGMVGLSGWRSDKFRLLPRGESVKTWTDYADVLNIYGVLQKNKKIIRSYPNGTRFDDILSDVHGKVFEHRVRTKGDDGRWRSEVIYEDKSVRPVGYTGLSVSCASCHREAGTGSYGVGLIPGGDTVISDPLDWSVWYKE